MIPGLRRLIICSLAILMTNLIFTPVQADDSDPNQESIIREGKDFATQVFGSPWDMNEYDDISTYLNQSGEENLLQNFQVANGIFSAQTTSLADGQFFPLFPGYRTAMEIGKVGKNYPIQSSRYKCLYVAMKLDSTFPEYFQVFWFADDKLNGTDGIWGMSLGQLIPAQNLGQYSLYAYDLSTLEIVRGNAKWNQNSYWQGLRIDPTNKANITFSVDWVRLTDCNPSNFTLTGLQSGQFVRFYLKNPAYNRTILIKETSTTSSTLDIDLQGVAAGTYTYTLNDAYSGSVIKSGTLTVNQAPIAEFTKPSYTSGEEFSVKSSTPWFFSNFDQIDSVYCLLDVAFVDELLNGKHTSILNFRTAALQNQPAGCLGGTVSDPIIYLHTPYPINSLQYRYLSYRIYTSGDVQRVPRGYITRWVWEIQGTSGRDGYRCHLVSQDIPHNVGWQTDHIDLFDSFNGLAEQKAGECPSGNVWWNTRYPVLDVRLDPNENITNQDIVQQLDWIMLTKMDEVQSGNPFRVEIGLNKPVAQITTKSLYYTTDRNNPTQNRANTYSAGVLPLMDNYAFLPAIQNRVTQTNLVPPENLLVYYWNTNNVPAADYYLCVAVGDAAQNSGTFCSETPVRVIAP